MKRALVLTAAILAGLLLLALPVQADPQSKSYSHWRLEQGELTATFTIPLRDLTALTPQGNRTALEQAWQRHLRETVAVQCELRDARTLPAPPGHARSRLRWNCPTGTGTLSLSLDLMFDRTASHLHFATFERAGAAREERLFSRSLRRQEIAMTPGEVGARPSATSVVALYIRFGFEHILIGLDHIAFLASLLLLPGRLVQVLWIVTGFTLGHSLTLTLATLGVVTPNLPLVEAMIGFSIALVATENVVCRSGHNRRAACLFALLVLALLALDLAGERSLPVASMLGLALFSGCYLSLGDSPERARRLRPAVTALFGLVHGFGFAAVLQDVGLPQGRQLPALLGFNLGVELGQVAIVAVLAGIGALWARAHRGAGGFAGEALSAALCSLGVYWFVQRLW